MKRVLFFRPFTRDGEVYFRIKQYASYLKTHEYEVAIVYPPPEKWSRVKKFLNLFPFNFLKEFSELARADVIFFTPNVALPFYVFFSKILGKKIVIEHITSFVSISEVIGRYPNFLERLAYKLSDTVIVYTESMGKDLIRAQKIDPSKIEVIYCNVDLDVFAPIYEDEVRSLKEELDIKKDQFVVFYHGMHHKWHGMDYLFEAAKMMETLRNDVVFVFFPGGPRWSERKGKNLRQIPEKGHFSDDLPKCIQLADVWCSGFDDRYPRGERTFSSTMIQALAMGRPIITSPGLEKNKFLKDGETAFFVGPRNPKAIIEKILFCINNPEIARKVGQNGRLLAQKMFSIDYLNSVIEKIVFGNRKQTR